MGLLQLQYEIWDVPVLFSNWIGTHSLCYIWEQSGTTVINCSWPAWFPGGTFAGITHCMLGNITGTLFLTTSRHPIWTWPYIHITFYPDVHGLMPLCTSIPVLWGLISFSNAALSSHCWMLRMKCLPCSRDVHTSLYPVCHSNIKYGASDKRRYAPRLLFTFCFSK